MAGSSKEASTVDDNSKDNDVTSSSPTILGNDFEEKTYRPTLKKNLIVIFMAIGYIFVNMVGAVVFKAIEKTPSKGTPHRLLDVKRDFLQNFSCLTEQHLEEFLIKLKGASRDSVSFCGNTTNFPDIWTFNSALILSFSIATTIGYGVVTPSTSSGQVFAVFFAIFSIPFTGILAAKLGGIMAYYAKKAGTKICPKKNVKCTGLGLLLLFGCFFFIVLPTLLLFVIDNEEDWSLFVCFYCIFISLTTIGFGDYVPDPSVNGGSWWTVIVQLWVVAGLAWFTSFIKLLASEMTRGACSLQQKLENSVKISSPKLLYKLDRSGIKFQFRRSHKHKANCHRIFGPENPVPLAFFKASLMNRNQGTAKDEVNRKSNVMAAETDCCIEETEIIGPGSFHAVAMSSGKHF